MSPVIPVHTTAAAHPWSDANGHRIELQPARDVTGSVAAGRTIGKAAARAVIPDRPEPGCKGLARMPASADQRRALLRQPEMPLRCAANADRAEA